MATKGSVWAEALNISFPNKIYTIKKTFKSSRLTQNDLSWPFSN